MTTTTSIADNICMNNVVGEIQLVYKTKVSMNSLPQITGPWDAHKLFFAQWNKGTISLREEFKVMLINNANKVLGIIDLFAGGTNATIADIKLVLASAIISNATSMVIAHNHPSGNAAPSEADKNLTKKIQEAARLLEIRLLDHIIITDDSSNFYSFEQAGQL